MIQRKRGGPRKKRKAGRGDWWKGGWGKSTKMREGHHRGGVGPVLPEEPHWAPVKKNPRCDYILCYESK